MTGGEASSWCCVDEGTVEEGDEEEERQGEEGEELMLV